MSYTVRLTDTAKQDLREIAFWIAEQSKDREIAKRFVSERYADGIKIRRLQCVMCLQKIDKLISVSHIYHPDEVYHITVAN